MCAENSEQTELVDVEKMSADLNISSLQQPVKFIIFTTKAK